MLGAAGVVKQGCPVKHTICLFKRGAKDEFIRETLHLLLVIGGCERDILTLQLQDIFPRCNVR